MRISDWSSDVCSSDLHVPRRRAACRGRGPAAGAEAPAQDDRRPRAVLRQGGQDRAYPPDGRDADDLRPGAPCLVVPAGLGAGADRGCTEAPAAAWSEEHKTELQSLMRISYAAFCLQPKTTNH